MCCRWRGTARCWPRGLDLTIKIWDTRSGACVKTWRGIGGASGGASQLCAVGGVERQAAGLGSSDSTIKIWDPRERRVRQDLGGHFDSVFSVAWNGPMLASGSSDNTIKIWDPGSGECVKTLRGMAVGCGRWRGTAACWPGVL